MFELGEPGKQFIAIMAKATDDFLIAGREDVIDWFIKQAQDRFIVGKITKEMVINFFGAVVSQDSNYNVTLSMRDYMKRLKIIDLSRTRRKQLEDSATEDEFSEVKRLAGTLIFLGNGALPPASYVASAMQQRLGNLKVKHLREINGMIKELMQLDPIITYKSPVGTITEASVCTFSDASFKMGKSQNYGQSGIITGIILKADGETIYQLVDWASTKQRRVSYSSYGAEILACAEADDRGFYVKSAISMLAKRQIRSQLCVDSKGIHDTITTLHDGKEYRLRQTVERLRDSFESQELNVLRWIPGTENIADALTKRNTKLYQTLNKICITGYLLTEIEHGHSLDSSTWK